MDSNDWLVALIEFCALVLLILGIVVAFSLWD